MTEEKCKRCGADLSAGYFYCDVEDDMICTQCALAQEEPEKTWLDRPAILR